MTVGELIDSLKTFDPTRVVVVSSDSEGNSYTKLRTLGQMIFANGEVYLEELTPADRGKGYAEEDVYSEDDGEKALVFWP